MDINTPCINPHKTKLFEAPCQRPQIDMTNIISNNFMTGSNYIMDGGASIKLSTE